MTTNNKPKITYPKSPALSVANSSTNNKHNNSANAEKMREKTRENIKEKPKTKARPKSKIKQKPKISNRELIRRIGIGFAYVMFAFAIFLFTAMSSYLFNWETDQVFKDFDIIKKGTIVANNICGPYGAYVGYVIIGKWFGIIGIILPIPIITLSLYLFKLNLNFLTRITISTIGGLIILPVAFTLITPIADPSTLGGGYGGGFGAYLYQKLYSTIGIVGVFLAVLLTLSAWLIYSFPRSYNMFTSLFRKLKTSADIIGDKINNTEYVEEDPTSKKTKVNTYNDTHNAEDEIITETCSDDNSTNTATDSIHEFIVTEDTDAPIKLTIKNSSEELSIVKEIEPIDTTEAMLEVDEATNGGIITPLTSEDRDIPIKINQSEPEDNKYEFKVSITGNAVIDSDSELSDTQIEINSIDEIDDNEFDQAIFDPTKELSSYILPPLDLLDTSVSKITVTNEELKENTKKIVDTLGNFNIKIVNIEATIGPTVTLYEIKPAPGVRISTIKRLEDDIACSLAAHGIRIIAPIPGKDTVGIEVPNKTKEIVSMYSVIKSKDFQETDAELPIVLGKTIQNKPYVVDLAKMPHLLVAGATGQGKSVGLNAIICSLLYKKHPAELKFVMVDPKKVEFSLYSSLERHFLAKLPDEDEAIITDTQKVIYTLNSLCVEMDSRYELLKMAKVRNIKEYNDKFRERRLNPNKGHKFLPYFVVIIDEFGDLILTAGKEIETPLTRLAALARAVGIHLVIATQRPTTNIITGTIKANFPARMAFRVISSIDSKTILDSTGASQLIGKGDMLILANNDTTRVQCAFIDTPEVERVTDYINKQVGFGSAYSLPEFSIETNDSDKNDDSSTISKRDALFDKVARFVVTNQQGSASTIQRNFEIGFNRAGRIMDQLEKAGVVGKQVGSKPRQVIISDLTQLEIKLINIDNPPYGY